jgi:hypothetical protein
MYHNETPVEHSDRRLNSGSTSDPAVSDDTILTTRVRIAETKRRSGYQAKGKLPSEVWQQRIGSEWAAIVGRHSTLR